MPLFKERLMMHWTPRRERMREILGGDKCIHPASVFDPLSARIAQDIGFEMGMYAGSTASLTVLGAPDLILLTLTEFAQQALRINRAIALPVMADADHGYGNALNVMRTVQELEAAGIATIMIEDTLLPAAFGETKARPISVEEGVGKMRAAVAARGAHGFARIRKPASTASSSPARARGPKSTPSARPRNCRSCSARSRPILRTKAISPRVA
jgi:carboxyvinyl-carboxyphosphonate phosphorylmutase